MKKIVVIALVVLMLSNNVVEAAGRFRSGFYTISSRFGTEAIIRVVRDTSRANRRIVIVERIDEETGGVNERVAGIAANDHLSIAFPGISGSTLFVLDRRGRGRRVGMTSSFCDPVLEEGSPRVPNSTGFFSLCELLLSTESVQVPVKYSFNRSFRPVTSE